MGVKVTIQTAIDTRVGYTHETFQVGGLHFRPMEMPDGSIHLQFYRLSDAPIRGKRKVHVAGVTLQRTPVSRAS